MQQPISVIVVDDHSLFRTGVVQSLHLDEDIRVVGEGSTGQDAVDLTDRLAPDIALVDISMPGNGIEAARKICETFRSTRVVMLTVSPETDDIMRAVEAGAVGYILKGISARDLIAAIRSIAVGEAFISPSLAVRLLDATKAKRLPSKISTLSAQEARTLQLVASGLRNSEVAAKLGITEKTVKFHLSNIFSKLGVRNRIEAALLAHDEWDEIEDQNRRDRND